MSRLKKDAEHPLLRGSMPKVKCPHVIDNKKVGGLRFGCKYDKSESLYFWPCSKGESRGCFRIPHEG